MENKTFIVDTETTRTDLLCDFSDTMENTLMQKIRNMPATELSGWLGMILVQSATLPTTVSVLLGYSDKLRRLSMVLLVWAGLALYFVRAFKNKDVLYMVSNGFGFFVNTILLALIVYPNY